MTSFFAVDNYSPLLVVAVGAGTFLALMGVGLLLIRLARVRVPSPWREVVSVLGALQLLSLTVQVMAMASLASRAVLIEIWAGTIALGCIGLYALLGRWSQVRPFRTSKLISLLWAVATLSIVANLLVAAAPSTKIDELYYHMLVPSRIVSDGELRFYRFPWEGAILPQMMFEIAMTPLHALGVPDASNVVSLMLGLTLIWFAWCFARKESTSQELSLLLVVAMCVGLYTVVWHVAAGAHAMGDLAMATSVVAICFSDRLRSRMSLTAYGFVVSMLLMSAAASKISLVPLCFVMLLMAFLSTARLVPLKEKVGLAFVVALPWLLFYLPILAWTWRASGSPWGPVLSNVVDWSVYDVPSVQNLFDQTRIDNGSARLAIQSVLVCSPLLWLAAVGALHRRLALSLLLAGQCAVIYVFLPHDARFLGGLQFGLAIVFVASAPRSVATILENPKVLASAVTALVLPWLAVQSYYASQFAPVSLGFSSPEAFYRRYVPFFDDFKRLDAILPKKGAILTGLHLSSVYCPRPIFMSPLDIPEGREIFLLGSSGAFDAQVTGYERGEVVYENPKAVIKSYRTPGMAQDIGPIFVIRLRKSVGSQRALSDAVESTP